MGYEDECALSAFCAIWGTDCKSDFDKMGGFIIWALFILYCFKVLASVCDGHLTSVLEVIVEKFHIPEDVAGATFLAMSSSAPELFHSILATFVLVSPSGVGNIVGSALFNLLVIVGVLPFVSKTGPLHIWWYPTVRDAFFYALAVIELLIFIADAKIVLWEAVIMVISYCSYVFYFTQNARILDYFGWEEPEKEVLDSIESTKDIGVQTNNAPKPEPLGIDSGIELSQAPENTSSKPVGPAEEATKDSVSSGRWCCWLLGGPVMEHTNGRPPAARPRPAPVLPGQTDAADAPESKQEDGDDEEPGACTRCDPGLKIIDATMPNYDWTFTAFVIVILWVGFYTYVMVDGANRFGCFINMPHVPMGLIILAAGTSVPDMVASISVASQGCADMAAANAVGSNTFDILLGLGLPWMIRCIGVGQVDIPVDELRESVLILAGALCCYCIFLRLNAWVLDVKIGGFMLAIYVGAICFILFRHYTHFIHFHDE